MYKTLRQESLRCVLPRIIICAVLAIALLAVSGGGLVKLMLGPRSLSELKVEELEGEYVSFDASEVIVAFASLSANNSDGGSQTLKTYYLLPVGDGRYMAVMDKKERNANILNRAMEQSREYYLGDLESLTRLGLISGTVTALEDDMTEFMADCIDNYELPGYQEGMDSVDLLVPCQVNLDYVGFLTVPVALGLGIAGVFFVLLAAVQLLVVMTGCYQKKLRDQIGDCAGDADFDAACQIERVRVGKYVWYTKGPGSRALDTSRLIWGYAMPEPMVVSKYRWPVALYDLDQNLTRINFMEQKDCQSFLDAIANQGNPFLKGYTSQRAQKFQSDFEGFQRDAEQEAKKLNTDDKV